MIAVAMFLLSHDFWYAFILGAVAAMVVLPFAVLEWRLHWPKRSHGRRLREW
jgi:hypothetical protein